MMIEKQKELTLSDFAKYCAVLMSINEKNFESVSKLDSFMRISKCLFDEVFLDFNNLKDKQNDILMYFHKTDSVELEMHFKSTFSILEKEKLINLEELNKLNNVFSLKAANKKSNDEFVNNNLSFAEKIDILLKTINDIKLINESKSITSRISHVEKNLQNKSFSIGITGVMNAGKSTLLNALMHSNILESSVVPETANLSIIKYSDTKYAKVNFWSKKEWNEIEESALNIESINTFVKKTKNIFKSNLDKYVQEKSVQLSIDINEISKYTSANHADKICNLVKSVELYIDLPFLKDGVVIVDTPGLDDPVVQREEITKQYLVNCDLLMHLMNVSQSATQKDIEFIIDAILYQGVSRLLIILTRVDTITKQELEEVKNYTKKSIQNQLEKHNKGALLNSILNKLEFIAVASKFALMHRTGMSQEALSFGYSEKDTGIFEVEQYLNNVLFGTNSTKASLLIKSNAKTLYNCAGELINSFSLEKVNLSKSSKELKKILLLKEEQNKKQNKDMEQIFAQIDLLKDDLVLFANSLLLEISQRVNSLKQKIHSRVYDDVKYELIKNNKKPKNDRVSYFVETGIKDGLIDIIRDYRFSFSKKSDVYKERTSLILVESGFNQIENTFDVKSFLNLHKHHVSINFITLKQNILNIIKKCKKSNLDEFSTSLDNTLASTFEQIKHDLQNILNSLNLSLISEFISSIEKPLNFKKSILEEEINTLKNQIVLMEKNMKYTQQRLKIIDEKNSSLINMQNYLKNLAF